jgi:hypothetical protein
MITRFDDYPVHQAPVPVAQPATGERNFYDRHWFNAFDPEAGIYLGAGLGLYPNRRIMDAHLSVLIDGEQHCLHASRRAPEERQDTRVGPLRVEVLEPLRRIRIRVEPNETGLEGELCFEARSAPYEEPRSRLAAEDRVILDTTRFTQLGGWQGELRVHGRALRLEPARFPGARDRSWGVRPVGEPEPGAPPTRLPGVAWFWNINHFDGLGTHFGSFEDPQGWPSQQSAALLPLHARPEDIPEGPDPGLLELGRGRLEPVWKRGTRWPEAAALSLTHRNGEIERLELTPRFRFHLKGIGYQHAEFGHGRYLGDDFLRGERFRVDELDPESLENIHAHAICEVRWGDRRGVGTLETLVFGPHRPSGLEGFLDGKA